jgi:hypothetical protein
MYGETRIFFPWRCLTKGKPPRKEVTYMNKRKCQQIVIWLALATLLGAAARFLEAVTELYPRAITFAKCDDWLLTSPTGDYHGAATAIID